MKHALFLSISLIFLLSACRGSKPLGPTVESGVATLFPTPSPIKANATETQIGLSAYATKRVATVISALTTIPPQMGYSTPIPVEQTKTAQVLDLLRSCSLGMYNLESPDKSLIASNCNTELLIINQDRYIITRLKHEAIFDVEHFPNNHDLEPIQWSQDNRYLYFEPHYCCWDSGLESLGTAHELDRLEISTGKIEKIIEGTFDYSFSSTGDLLVELQENQLPLKARIRNLRTNKVTDIKLDLDPKYRQAGNILWSPDGSKFVFIAGYGLIFGDNTDKQIVESLIEIDFENGSQKILFVRQMEWIEPYNWSKDNIITLTSSNFIDHINTMFQFDLNKSQIISSP